MDKIGVFSFFLCDVFLEYVICLVVDTNASFSSGRILSCATKCVRVSLADPGKQINRKMVVVLWF
jgi:hypothetical protein